jgi:hypothetical protein
VSHKTIGYETRISKKLGIQSELSKRMTVEKQETASGCLQDFPSSFNFVSEVVFKKNSFRSIQKYWKLQTSFKCDLSPF